MQCSVVSQFEMGKAGILLPIDESAAITDKPASRERALRNVLGDAAGGFAAALIAIPQAMGLGVLAFAALGPEYAAVGVAAGFFSSIIGNLVAGAIPAARCQIFGARASATVVFAGIVAALVAHPLLQTPGGPDIPRVVTLALAAVFLAGVFQLGFGVLGLGRAIKFMPYPVIAGFMNGIALTIIVSQLGPALGIETGRPLLEALRIPGAIRPLSLLITVAVVVVIFVVPRVTRKVPALLCGLVAGVTLHHLAILFAPDMVGQTVGKLPDMQFAPHDLTAMFELAGSEEIGTWGAFLLPSALLLAAVSSLDGLLAAVITDPATSSRHHSNRLLKGQGVANAIAAVFGAIPIVMSTHTRVANYLAGGRTPLSTLFHALFMLSVLLALAPVIAMIPMAALAGLMIYIAFTLVDRWTRDLVRRLRDENANRAELLLNLGVVIGVALSLLVFNLMVAFAVGIAAAVFLLLVRLSDSPVRRVLDGTVRTSLKVREPEARVTLHSLAKQIRIFELEGEIFFGTADRLQVEVERAPEHIRYVILDFRHVSGIDASGARALETIAQMAASRRVHVLLSHMREDDSHGRYLRGLGIAAAVGPEHWHPDLDRALEWAEDRLLLRARFEDAPELQLRNMALFEGLDSSEMEIISALLERHELKHGDTVFTEGGDGDRMYLIARGAVSIKIGIEGEARARRLATFVPGVFFGEMAMIEQQRRSADAFAKGEQVVLYSLGAERFAGLVQQYPQLSIKIYRNLSRELTARLRATSGALRALE